MKLLRIIVAVNVPCRSLNSSVLSLLRISNTRPAGIVRREGPRSYEEASPLKSGRRTLRIRMFAHALIIRTFSRTFVRNPQLRTKGQGPAKKSLCSLSAVAGVTADLTTTGEGVKYLR